MKYRAESEVCSTLGLCLGVGGDISELSLLCLEIRHKSFAKQEVVSLGLTRTSIAVTLH